MYMYIYMYMYSLQNVYQHKGKDSSWYMLSHRNSDRWRGSCTDGHEADWGKSPSTSWGMPLSLQKKDHDFVIMFFIRLFRDTFLYSFVFRSIVSFLYLKKGILFLLLSSFALRPYIYKYFLGVAKDPFSGFRDVDPAEDDWRHS